MNKPGYFGLAYGVIVMTMLAVTGNLQAQQTYTLSGEVTTGGAPMAGASVFIVETHQGTVSGADGLFTLENIRSGIYTLYVSSVGYERFSKRIVIPRDQRMPVSLVESVQALDAVEVEGSAFRQTQHERSVVIERVSANEIAMNAGTTLMNSLERLPGVSSINMGVGVSKPVIRGMSFNRVVVNDSGVKHEGQQWGSDHGLEIDQFNVEDIQIVRGPASLAYGSDALGGVLDIRHPVMKMPGEHAAEVNTFYRSNNHTVGTTAAASGNHDGFVYKARATYLDYGDYRVPATEFYYNRFVLPIYDQALKNTAGAERHGSVLLGVQKNWGFSHVAVSNYNQDIGIFSGAMGIPRSYQLTPDGDSRNIDLPFQRVNHFKVISNSNIKLGDHWLEVDAGYQKNVRQEHSYAHAHGSGDVQQGTLALQLDLHTWTLNARHYAGRGNHHSTVGVQSSFQHNVASGYEFLIPGYRTWQAAGFWLHQVDVSDKLILNGGLRADLASTQAKSVRYPFYHENQFIDSIARSPEVDRRFFNYSAGLGASYNIHPDHWLKLNFGKTFRVPVPSELTANGMHHGTFRYEVGDDALKPEEGFQFDAAWVYTGKVIQVTVSPFYNYFKNYIYLSPSGIFPTVEIDGRLYPIAEAGQMYTFRQTEAIHTGGEVALAWRARKAMVLSLNGEYVRVQNGTTRLPLPFTPPASIQFIADLALPRWKVFRSPQLNINAGYYFSQHRVERNEPSTDAYPLVNLGSGFGLGKRYDWLYIRFNVQNLLDRRYMNHLSRYRILNLPEPARSFVVSLAFKWKNRP